MEEEERERLRESERERLRRRRDEMEEQERKRLRESERNRSRRRRRDELDEGQRQREQHQDTRQHQLHRASQSPESARRSNRVRQQQRRAATATATAPASVGIYVGPMTTQWEHCQALRFPRENLNCCHSGKVSLPALVEYPQPLKDLLTGPNSEARNFRDNIRHYNSAFSFASFGAQTIQVSATATTEYSEHFNYAFSVNSSSAGSRKRPLLHQGRPGSHHQDISSPKQPVPPQCDGDHQHSDGGGQSICQCLSSSVVLTAEDTMSQHTMRLQQFLLARTEHHLQTGTLWCTPGIGHRRGCPISPVMFPKR